MSVLYQSSISRIRIFNMQMLTTARRYRSAATQSDVSDLISELDSHIRAMNEIRTDILRARRDFPLTTPSPF